MKKILLIATFATLTASIFVGCNDDDDDFTIVKPAIINVDASVTDLTLEAGQKLFVKKGGSVGNLTVKGGEVTVANGGKLGKITVPADAAKSTITINTKPSDITGPIENAGKAKIYWSAFNADDLRAILAKSATENSGVNLAANIRGATVAVEGEKQDFLVGNGDPTLYDGYIVDGKEFTIDGVSNNNVISIIANNAIVKNLTVTQTAEQKTVKSNSGIHVYRSTGVTLENVTVENCGSAGVIVNGSEVNATNLNTKNNVWGSVNVSKGTGVTETPKFTLVSGTLEENVKIYVDIAKTGSVEGTDYKVTTPTGWESGMYKNSSNLDQPAFKAYYPIGAAPGLHIIPAS